MEEYVELPILQKGDSGDAVEAAQMLLIGRGYSCGKWGADGDFGRDTAAAVMSFQEDHGLEVDAVIGPCTYRALICGEE